jgi:hypothetical protein
MVEVENKKGRGQAQSSLHIPSRKGRLNVRRIVHDLARVPSRVRPPPPAPLAALPPPTAQATPRRLVAPPPATGPATPLNPSNLVGDKPNHQRPNPNLIVGHPVDINPPSNAAATPPTLVTARTAPDLRHRPCAAAASDSDFGQVVGLRVQLLNGP